MSSHRDKIIERMCQLGARPPIIQSYFRDVSMKQIRIIYKEVTGNNPQKGQLPIIIQIYFETRFSVQSSLVAKVYIESTKSGATEAEALIHAYEVLQIMYDGLVILSFSQVWHITRYIEIDQFALKQCDAQHLYLFNRKGVHASCPVCKDKIRENNVKMSA